MLGAPSPRPFTNVHDHIVSTAFGLRSSSKFDHAMALELLVDRLHLHPTSTASTSRRVAAAGMQHPQPSTAGGAPRNAVTTTMLQLFMLLLLQQQRDGTPEAGDAPAWPPLGPVSRRLLASAAREGVFDVTHGVAGDAAAAAAATSFGHSSMPTRFCALPMTLPPNVHSLFAPPGPGPSRQPEQETASADTTPTTPREVGAAVSIGDPSSGHRGDTLRGHRMKQLVLPMSGVPRHGDRCGVCSAACCRGRWAWRFNFHSPTRVWSQFIPWNQCGATWWHGLPAVRVWDRSWRRGDLSAHVRQPTVVQ